MQKIKAKPLKTTLKLSLTSQRKLTLLNLWYSPAEGLSNSVGLSLC